MIFAICFAAFCGALAVAYFGVVRLSSGARIFAIMEPHQHGGTHAEKARQEMRRADRITAIGAVLLVVALVAMWGAGFLAGRLA